jgi:putative pyruvate formate lyase activating enzyme
MWSELKNCTLCPRNCRVDRFKGGNGYCKSDAGYSAASICIHRGEEPVISGSFGICNIFFPHCNLQCIYCQNYQISRNESRCLMEATSLKEIMDKVIRLLELGCESVGFVSPTHYLPHVHTIIESLHSEGFHPVMVYNSNGYDKVEMLQAMETKIDVFLPDFKYIDPEIAGNYSDAKDYPEVAKRTVKEMFRQMGSSVIVSSTGTALRGIIIRHLVLPGLAKDSIKILQWIAEELSPSVYISLMAQYYPPGGIQCPTPLQRRITPAEYEAVVKEMEFLGFCHGWIQELDSPGHYIPDFSRDQPFR